MKCWIRIHSVGWPAAKGDTDHCTFNSDGKEGVSAEAGLIWASFATRLSSAGIWNNYWRFKIPLSSCAMSNKTSVSPFAFVKSKCFERMDILDKFFKIPLSFCWSQRRCKDMLQRIFLRFRLLFLIFIISLVIDFWRLLGLGVWEAECKNKGQGANVALLPPTAKTDARVRWNLKGALHGWASSWGTVEGHLLPLVNFGEILLRILKEATCPQD